MAEYAQFIDGVSFHLYECPRPIILNAIKSSVMQFCNDSRIWIYDCQEFQVTNDQNRYILNIPNDATICYIHSVYGRDNRKEHAGGNNRSYRRQPYLYHLESPNQLVIDEPQIETTILKPVVSLKPLQDALDCADILFDSYYETIVSGAVYRLMMQSSASWSNPNLAAMHMQIFQDGISRAVKAINDGIGLTEPNYRTTPSYL